ncbi:MAG: chromate efflux transporter [Rubellimicrobium sp.]|nr:chromate efflux transporter [Rubellimicrobium sp.]
MSDTDLKPHPSLPEATRVWLRIGLFSFGGPAGQIALMHRLLVEERGWLDDRRFVHALNYCMLLPGPEAMQLAVYIGWIMHRTAGGVVAGLLFVLPGALAILALSFVYALYGNVGTVEAAFFGLKAVVLAIVLQAVIRIGRKMLGNPALVAVAALSFLAIFVFGLPFPLIILTAGLAGLAGARAGRPAFAGPGGQDHVAAAAADDPATMPRHVMSERAHALRISVVFLTLWLAPVAILLLTLGAGNVFARIAGFFSVLAIVTFGGAYAVLAYVAQEAVQSFGWLAPGEMLDGLGMAETTPGPLILVTQFVGFMAAFRDPGGLPPLVAGTLGGILTLWVTFVPSFLMIFLGAPYIERLRGNAALSGAMTAISAAVVGVILNLALWFAIHAVFGEVTRLGPPFTDLELPVWSSLDPLAAGLALLALVAVFGLGMGTIGVLAGGALAGIVLGFAGLV